MSEVGPHRPRLVLTAAVATTLAALACACGSSKHQTVTPQCPATPPATVDRAGTGDSLISGSPDAATLCTYASESSGYLPHASALNDTQWATIESDLEHASITRSTCQSIKIDPTALLILHTPQKGDQQLLIDLSGCMTVSNGTINVFLPQSLEELLPGHPHGNPPTFNG